MKVALLLLGGAALAGAVAMPTPGGGDYYPGGGGCSDGPEVFDGEWQSAREGKRLPGVTRPPVYPAVETSSASGDFKHVGCANGVTLRSLEIWGRDTVDGILLTFHDGEQFAAGEPWGCYQRHDFLANEKLLYLEQSSDGRLEVKLEFGTSARDEFVFGRDSRGETRSVAVHSGFICGISGNDAERLGELTFLFAPKAEVVSVVIDPMAQPGVVAVTERSRVFKNVNPEDVPRISYRPLSSQVFKYKSDSNLGYWELTSVEVPEDGSARDDAVRAPFRAPHVMFESTREFNLDSSGQALELEIPPLSQCTAHVTETVAVTEDARWTGTETYLLDDGTTFSLRIGGTMGSSFVIDRSTQKQCVHSSHFDNHDWEDHCVGYACGDDDHQCCGDLECIDGMCQSPVLFPPVPPPDDQLHSWHVHDWLRHCAGAPCKDNDSCCGDLVCDPSTKTCVSPFLFPQI